MKKFFALGLLVFAGTLALASADGTASGTLTIKGKPVKLQYAYAWHEPDPFDSSKKVTVVMVSDVKLTAEQATDDFEPMEMAKNGKLNAVRLTIDGDETISQGMFYSGQLENGSFGAGGMHKFDKKVLTDVAVEGKAYMDKPRDFFGTTYTYEATFKAPIAKGKKK